MATNCKQIKDFEYSDSDFIWETVLRTYEEFLVPSRLDHLLNSLWYMSKANFRYNLNITESKVLDGKYKFVAQLNTDRALNRREPQEIKCLNQPFDRTKFNFTQIKEDEILFQLKYVPSTDTDEAISHDRDLIAINVSPLEKCHCLVLPSVDSCNPQVISKIGLQLITNILLLSSNVSLRAGFNSLCGYASVNHEHYHTYHLEHHLYLETADVEHLSGPCFMVLNYPAKCFAFELKNHHVDGFVSSIYSLTSFLQRQDVAHNLFLTRGVQFSKGECTKGCYDTIRAFVWARKPTYGAKEVDAFNPALCELSGHLPVKNAESYKTLTEQEVSDILTSVCDEEFHKVKEMVPQLYQR